MDGRYFFQRLHRCVFAITQLQCSADFRKLQQLMDWQQVLSKFLQHLFCHVFCCLNFTVNWVLGRLWIKSLQRQNWFYLVACCARFSRYSSFHIAAIFFYDVWCAWNSQHKFHLNSGLGFHQSAFHNLDAPVFFHSHSNRIRRGRTNGWVLKFSGLFQGHCSRHVARHCHNRSV